MPDLPPASRSSLSRGVSRRAVTLAAGGLSLTAGCSRSSTEPSPQPAAAVSASPDVQVATQALVAVRGALQAARSTGQQFPGMRSTLAALTTMHQAHERSLVDAVPPEARSTTTPPSYVVAKRRASALKGLEAAEVSLHDTLTALASKAQSGEFARLLASMAVGVTLRRRDLAAGAAP